MAMVGNDLGDAMQAAIDALSNTDKANRQKVFRAMGTAIVTYIQAHAQVASTVAVTSVSGVTVGAGVSGPGAGTATGTIT